MAPKVLKVLKFDSPSGAEGCGIAYGDEYMLWRSFIGPPSQPKLALSLPIKGPSFCRLTVVGGGGGRL